MDTMIPKTQENLLISACICLLIEVWAKSILARLYKILDLFLSSLKNIINLDANYEKEEECNNYCIIFKRVKVSNL